MTTRWESLGTIIDVTDWDATHIDVTVRQVAGVRLGHIHARHQYGNSYEVRLRPVQAGDKFSIYFDRHVGPITPGLLAGRFRPEWAPTEWSEWRQLDA